MKTEDRDEDDDVQGRDDVEEEARYQHTDDVRDVVEPRATVLHLLVQGADSEVQKHRHDEHDRRVP